MTLAADLYSLIANDAGITAQIATLAGDPAIFSTRVPREAECPYIYISEVGTSAEQENRCARGYQQVFDVWVIDDRTGSLQAAREIAQSIWDVVHRTAFNDGQMSGWFESLGIRQMSDSDQFPGVSMTVVARAWEA